MNDARDDSDEIVASFKPGDEVVPPRDEKQIASICEIESKGREQPRLGTLQGSILHVEPEFDAIPEGFEEYLP
jgi:hypothetical protein